jgi:hypothetical protein
MHQSPAGANASLAQRLQALCLLFKPVLPASQISASIPWILGLKIDSPLVTRATKPNVSSWA